MNTSSSGLLRYVAHIGGLPLPDHRYWLSEAEQSELAVWKDGRRREQWLAGRWVAKRMVVPSTAPEELRRVEVLSRSTAGLGTVPRVLLDGEPLERRLSISHAGTSVLVALGAPQSKVGVDLALEVPHSAAFRKAWFSPRENGWLEADPARRVPVLWGLKEAIFKAQADGQAWNPRAVEVVAIKNNSVQSELYGLTIASLAVWIRPAPRGAATVVWERPLPDLQMQGRVASPHEVTTCL